MKKTVIKKKVFALLLATAFLLGSVAPQILTFANLTPPADVIIIDDENAINETNNQANIANWAGTVETNIVKVGNKSLKSKSDSNCIVASQYVWRTTQFNTTKDITAVTTDGTSGALRFWFYIEDISTFDAKNRDESKGFVKIGTTTWKNETTPNSGPDAGNFYRWNGWTTQVTQSGWNEIILKFEDATTQNGKPDLTCIDKFMITYPDSTASTTAYIDNFRVSADTGEGIDETPVNVLIIDDENAINETNNQANIANWAGTVETNIVKVGNKSLKSKSDSNYIVASQYVWRTTQFNAPKDISAVTTGGTSGTLRFWFYIEDISTFDAKNRDESKGFVKIGTTTWKNETTPNSGPDAGNFYRWNGWTTQVTQSGWNEIILKFEDATTQNGKPDLTCIDKFMITYPDGTASTTAYIDEFKVSADSDTIPDDEPDEPKDPEEPDNTPIEKVELPVEGTKSGKGLLNVVYSGFTVDASKVANPHLQISIYIAKDDDTTASVTDLLGKRQIELTSSGTYDKAEIHWDMTQFTLETGWNNLLLPLSEAIAHEDGSKFDISAINYFRFYNQHLAGDVQYTLKVKDIAIVSVEETAGPENPENPEEPDNTPIEKVELPVEGTKSGKGLLNVVYSGFTVDASKVANPHLQISIYIAKDDDTTASVTDLLGKRQIELTSSGTYDKAEIHWDMTQFTLETGWNNLLLPLSEAIAHEEGSKFDISAINYFRFYNQHLAGDVQYTLKVKDIAIVSVEETEEDKSVIKPKIIAYLNGTEWPIVHPGLSGQFNSADYEAMNFDRRFCGIPTGDIKTAAYVTRQAAKLPAVNATEHNVFTFDIVVEDNESWDTYKDGLIIKIKTINNGEIAFSSTAVREALKNVVPGEKCRVVLSLASVGKKNLSEVDGFKIELGDTISEKVIHLTITNARVEYSEGYPTVSEEPIIDDEEEKIEVLFAKLDGTEWPIVHPGLSGEFHKPDFDAMNFDRYLNFAAKGDVRNYVDVNRTDVYKNQPVDFTKCNVLIFNVNIEDNGAWADYKDKIKITLISTDGVSHPLTSADVSKAFSNIVFGEWCKVTVSLSGVHKGELKDIKTIKFSLSDGSSDKNLHLRVLRIVGEYNKNFEEVPEIPSNDDPTLILNDEYGEKAWPATLTNDISKLGKKSYSATTFVTDKGYNEGWLIRMGFWGNPLNRTLDIKSFTADGTQGAIRFWVYADNAEEVRTSAAIGAGSYCRYGSTKNWDGDAFEWRGWANQIIYDGWNEIVLPFDIATKHGNPDLTKMSAFALKFGEGNVDEVPKTQIYIDDIRLSKNTKTALPISYEPTIKGAKMFQPFDETTGFNKETKMTSFELDLKEKTQGMASLKFSTETGNFVWVYRAGKNAVDATGYNAVEFDLYVSNPEFFEYAGGQLELTSSGIWDQNEMAFNLKELKLDKGWNHVKFSFDFANYSLNWKGEPDIDLTNINFMRLYTGTAQSYVDQEVSFRIDNMCFTKNGEIKVEKSITITNDTGYEIYLTAKPNVIPQYGQIVVKKNEISELPETVETLFANEKNTVILTTTYYKDSIEYLFNDSVTVHLSQEKFAGFKNKYLYRLDINGSFKKLSRIDNKSKKELVWDEPTRLTTYIISDVLIEDDVIRDVENQTNDNSLKSNVKLVIVIGVATLVLAVLIGGTVVTINKIKKRKIKGNI